MDESPRSSELDELEAEVAAVGSPSRGRRRGFGVGGWIAVGWMVLLVGSSLLAPILPFADPDGEQRVDFTPGTVERGAPRRRLQRP